ncbi:LPXTG cell wall anchor domain-containing protein, partial [Enterococcus ureasiticus]|uniref:LPXTG cell wall anchor domain-containing protein n=3 Tax=Enterococcus TaxID=1350 RepID=UPI001A8F6621
TESTSTESSSSEEATPSIEVTDQTVYVGQTLTEDIVLSWATFKNADGLTVGFEVVGEPIQVTALGNTLVEPGTHKIRFYVSKPAQQRSSETVVAEKVITLNVLPESANPLNQTLPEEETNEKETKAPNKDLISQVASPISNTAKKTIDSAKTTAKQLPSTGETNNGMMIASAGVVLIAGAYIFRKKQLD